ncbi:MAG: hypothetical protein IT392_05270 [Nitrospirae bacterium]|nr:hypothetical protein [Nitrospirota bacterium]
MKRILQVLSFFTAICIAGISASYAFELNGFADVSFTKSSEGNNRKDKEYRNGDFNFGTLDLYLAQSIDDIDILFEMIVENGDEVDLERLTIGYTFSDEVKLRVGRFHAPLGFWNTAYHHGVQLQPTIKRPVFLKFDDHGGILPTHVVGADLVGRVKTGIGAVTYDLMIGNGSKITGPKEGETNVLYPNNTSDNNIGKAVAFNAAISPAVVDGLKVGVSGHIAKVMSDDSAALPVSVNADQTIFGGFLIYSTGNLNLSGEYFTIENKNEQDSKKYDSRAYYGLVTYAVTDKWVPYVMYENLQVKDNDPYVISLGAVDTEKLTAGLRYNINYRSSVKVEYRDIINEKNAINNKDSDWSEYAVQWALAF